MTDNGYIEPTVLESSPTCLSKRGFAEADARRLAEFAPSNREDPDNWIRAYKCPHCAWWHLGHAAQEVVDGLADYDEWYTGGARRAVRNAAADIIRTTGLTPTWSRVGEAWRATVDHPAVGEVSSKPSADPGLAAEHLLTNLRRIPCSTTPSHAPALNDTADNPHEETP